MKQLVKLRKRETMISASNVFKAATLFGLLLALLLLNNFCAKVENEKLKIEIQTLKKSLKNGNHL